MRTLFTIRGFSADGRNLGLGLAAAMDKQRREAARDVEAYLHRTTDDRPRDDRLGLARSRTG